MTEPDDQSHDREPRDWRASAPFLAGLIAAGAAAAAAGMIAVRQARQSRPHDSAPGRTARRTRFGRFDVVGKTVTVNRPRRELYAFWRDFQNLPQFMENIIAVRSTGPHGRAVWTIAAPAGSTVDVETTIAEERPDELIAWRSTPDSDIETEGRVAFRDAPAGRGTIVEAIIAYRPPGGELGRLIAKAFQREPELQARRDLRRFKMLMETGEIATAAHRRHAA